MELAHFWGILFISLHAMVPITLAAIGETIEESAGLFNIGLEGILLLGALAGALGAQASGSAVIGLMTGIGIGAMVGLIFGTIGTTLRGSQLITGVGINLFSLGFVALMLTVMGAPGFHSVARDVQVPLIPLGVGNLSPLVILSVVLAIGVWWLLRRTQLGIWIRAVGENPAAADVAGLRVNAIRLGAAVAAGAFAGLAGAYLSVDWFDDGYRDRCDGGFDLRYDRNDPSGKPVDHWRRDQSFCAGVCGVDAECDGRARFS